MYRPRSLRRSTLVKILKELLYRSMSRSAVAIRWNPRSPLDQVLSTKYPLGLRGLVVEEGVRSPNNYPQRQWTITHAGVLFLDALRTDPKAMPEYPVSRPRKYMGSASRTYAAQRRRRQRNIRKVAARQQPKHSAAAYLEPVHIDPASPAFRRLSNLDKIRSLRTHARLRRKGRN